MGHTLDSILKEYGVPIQGKGRPGVVAGTASPEHLERKQLFSVLGTPAGMDPKDTLSGHNGTAPVPSVAIYDEKPIHRTMVLLRAGGKTYKEIAEATEYSEVHVRTVCCQPWARQRMTQLAMDGQLVVQDLLASELVPCIETLVEIRDDKKVPAASRIMATKEILDRFLGKAPQTLDVTHNKSKPDASMEDLDNELNGLRERQNVLAGKGAVRTVTVTVSETRSEQE